MEPKQLSELPLVFQIIAGFGLFFGTFTLAIGGWLWKNIKGKLPESLQPAESSTTDVVIKSASIADSKSISSLAGSIETLIQFLKDEAEDETHQLSRNRSVLIEIRDNLADLASQVEALVKTIRTRTIV